MKELYITLLKTEDILLKTKDGLLKTEDILLKTKDGLLKTEDVLLKTKYGLLNTEDVLLKTNDSLLKNEDNRKQDVNICPACVKTECRKKRMIQKVFQIQEIFNCLIKRILAIEVS